MPPKVLPLEEKLHGWYLEATKELKPGSYNEDAQKPYSELTDEQKSIDAYIANKIRQEIIQAVEKVEIEKAPHDECYLDSCGVCDNVYGWNNAREALESKKKEIIKSYET